MLNSRWLVTGATGMLGAAVCERLAAHGARTTALGRGALDVTDPRAVEEAIAAARPAVVVNCAAWTAVDAAEGDEEGAHRVNAEGPRHLARACARAGARLVHLSTDYVFGGAAADIGTPYREDADPAPRTAYGRTKLAGERAALAEHPAGTTVLRTGWLYGRHGRSFVGTMAGLAAGAGTAEVVDDQFGQPTWTGDVAARILAVAGLPAAAAAGVLHATSSGWVSWHELASEVFRLLGADPARVRATTSADLARPARRPAWSVLAHGAWARTGLPPLRGWRPALAEALEEAGGAWIPY